MYEEIPWQITLHYVTTWNITASKNDNEDGKCVGSDNEYFWHGAKTNELLNIYVHRQSQNRGVRQGRENYIFVHPTIQWNTNIGLKVVQWMVFLSIVQLCDNVMIVIYNFVAKLIDVVINILSDMIFFRQKLFILYSCKSRVPFLLLAHSTYKYFLKT